MELPFGQRNWMERSMRKEMESVLLSPEGVQYPKQLSWHFLPQTMWPSMKLSSQALDWKERKGISKTKMRNQELSTPYHSSALNCWLVFQPLIQKVSRSQLDIFQEDPFLGQHWLRPAMVFSSISCLRAACRQTPLSRSWELKDRWCLRRMQAK